MDKYTDIIKLRSYKERDYQVSNELPHDVSLNNKYVVYIVSGKRRIIRLSDMLKGIVLYDTVYKAEDTMAVSVVVNPITLMACTYHGKVTVEDIDADTHNFILSKNKIKFQMGQDPINDKMKKNVYGCKIMRLRDVYMFDPDPLYVTVTKSYSNIFQSEYLTSKRDIFKKKINDSFHPKTLVYVVRYLSKSNKNKQTILLGKQSNSREPTGMNYKDGKYGDYLAIYSGKLYEKRSLVIPMFLYYANRLYPDAKLLSL